jgi:hypothetical protein
VSLLPIAGSHRPPWMPAARARPHSATAARLSAFQGRSELGDILTGLPPTLKARLFAAIDLTILWNKTGGQVTTTTATISDATLAGLPAILDPTQDGYHDALRREARPPSTV